MPPIIVYHHGLFYINDILLPSAIMIAQEQVKAVKESGLAEAASELNFFVNGGKESEPLAKAIFPEKSKIKYWGLGCRNENLTVMALWEHAKKIEGEAYFLYQHQKGSSHSPGSDYGENVVGPWRRGMTQDLVWNWTRCVADLESHDIVCSHWMWNMADGSQHIPAGGFLWIKASFVRQLPSMYLRDRIKQDGIEAISSRYESEVFWGNGPKPNVKSYRPNGGNGVP